MAVIELGVGSVGVLIAELDAAGRMVPVLSEETTTRPDDGEALARLVERAGVVADDRGPVVVAVINTGPDPSAEEQSSIRELVAGLRGPSTTTGPADVDVESLTADRRAQLALAGALHGWDPVPAPVTMVDVGPAATTFAVGAADRAGAHGARGWTLPLGGRTLTGDYLRRDPPAPAELSSALSVVELHLEDLRRELPDLAAGIDTGTVVGAGWCVDIAAVEHGMLEPGAGVDRYRLSRSAVEEVFRALATESAGDRAHNPGLRRELVHDIVGALCVLVEFQRRFGVEELLVAEGGVRHGLAVELLTAARPDDRQG